jgi:glycosyltransferase involved in cell wall biosynthesis
MVAYFYPPDNFSGAIRAGRFVKYLRKLGHPVTVLAAAAENLGPVGEDVHRVRGEFAFEPRRDSAAFLERAIHKILLPSDWGYTWAWRAAVYAARFMRREPRPVVISTFPPLACHWVGLLLKKRYGAPWIADFRDPYWGSPLRNRRRAVLFDRRMQRAIFRNADVAVATTDVMLDLWRPEYPQWCEKMHLIWNGYDPEEALGPAPLPPRPHRVIAHVGAIYSKRHPNQLLASLARLTGRGLLDPASVKVRLVGSISEDGSVDRELLDRMKSSGLLELTPELPRAAAQQVMATSDYLLLLDMMLDVPSINVPSINVPAKLYEYIRVGRPILLCTTSNSPSERVLALSGVSYRLIQTDDTEAETDRKVLDFLSLPTEPRPLAPAFTGTFEAMSQAVYLSGLVEAAARSHAAGSPPGEATRPAAAR